MGSHSENADFLAFRDSGSPDALARVFDVVAPRLLLLAGHVTRDEALAEDLVQTTFLQAMRDAQGYDGERPVAIWLAGILRNRALDMRRRGVLREAQSLPEDLGETIDPAGLVGDRELFDEALAAVEALPEPYREVLLLRLVHGLTPAAIAHTLGRAPGTVRMQLQRGTERLRRALPDRRELVGALLLAPVRGLSELRETVLAQAGAGSNAARTLTILGGIGVSKVLLAVAGLLLAFLALVFGTGMLGAEKSPQTPIAGAAETMGAETLAATQEPAMETAEPSSGREIASSLAESEAGLTAGALTITVRFAEDGALASDVGVYVRPVEGGLGVELRTDAAGQARFENLPSGLVEVHVDRERERMRVDPSRQDAVEFLLQRGATLQGRVIDLEDVGVAGAAVYRINEGHHDVLHRVATCGDDGSFTVRGLAEDMDLIARAAGYQPSELRRARKGDIELQLGASGCSLKGRVLDADGSGVPFAWIVVGVDEDARDDPAGSTAVPGDGSRHKALDREGILLRADEAGRFTSDEIPGGNVVVIARSFDGRGAGVAWETLWMSAEGEQEVQLWLRPGAEVVGVLRDESGRPVAGAELEAEWEGTPLLGQMEDRIGPYVSDRRVVSGVDGSFVLDGLLPGDYDLRVQGERDELLRAEVVLAAGERHAWEPIIAAQGSLEVTLLDPSGQPLEGWIVGASPHAGRFPGWRFFANTTDVAGHVRLADLEDRVEHELSVYPAGSQHRFPAARRLVTVVGGTTLEVKLAPHEQPTCTLVGRLLGRDGVAYPVSLTRPGWDQDHDFILDASGTFRIGHLIPGEVALTTRSGVRSSGVKLGSWTLIEGEESDVGDVQIPAVPTFSGD